MTKRNFTLPLTQGQYSALKARSKAERRPMAQIIVEALEKEDRRRMDPRPLPEPHQAPQSEVEASEGSHVTTDEAELSASENPDIAQIASALAMPVPLAQAYLDKGRAQVLDGHVFFDGARLS